VRDNRRYGVLVAGAESEGDLPTTTIERETLRDLLDLTVEPLHPPPPHPPPPHAQAAPYVQHAHTVPRGQVRRREEPTADDLDAQLSPLVVLGVLGLLLVVFIAVSHLH